jgi:hypothetical protein
MKDRDVKKNKLKDARRNREKIKSKEERNVT